MGNVGWTELLLIFLVILLVFGAKRIPEIARGLGRGIREFKDATTDIKRELTVGDQPAPPGPPAGQARYAQPGALPDQQGYQPAAPAPPPPAAASAQQPAPSSAAPPEGEG
jgi:sec-independent protein translocase protein TatA